MAFGGEPVCPDAITIGELDEASEKKAKDELHEDPKDRMGAIETLRTWVIEQPHITARTDNRYLLAFLRGAKFSQLRAREMIEGTLQMKSEHSDWFRCVDPADPKIQKVIEQGGVVPLPGKTKDGCGIILQRIGAIDPDTKDFTVEDQIKASMVMSSFLFLKPWVQVNGCVFFIDFTGYTMRHATRIGFDKMQKFHKSFQNKMPGRFKAFHYYNTGTVFETVFAIMKPFIGKKFIERIVMHGSNLETLYNYIPLHLLPDEYLPDEYDGPSAGTIKNITDKLKKEVQEPSFRDWVMYDSHPKWKYDASKKEKDAEPQSSFRKLNID